MGVPVSQKPKIKSIKPKSTATQYILRDNFFCLLSWPKTTIYVKTSTNKIVDVLTFIEVGNTILSIFTFNSLSACQVD